MSPYVHLCSRSLIFIAAIMASVNIAAQPSAPIPGSQITALQSQLSEATQITSSARQKIALRRLAREAESTIEKNPGAPNRFEVMDVLFRTQQAIFKLQGNEANRQAIFNTCKMLAQAPDEYAEIRWDADLLLSQSQVARQGGGVQQRALALRDLVDRYLGTAVEKKAVRIALIMAVEAGEARLIEYLDQLISERFADDLAMIAFKRDKLPAQVFGATFYADLRENNGGLVRFPMDSFGTTTAFLFWSNDKDGQANLKEIAEVLKEQQPEEADRRLKIYSINLDELPDAGESILREHGLDWPALHLPGGRDSLPYKAYARVDPKFVTISPTGIASLFQTGGNMHGKGFKRWLGSSKARNWVKLDYCTKLQSLASGDFLILDPKGDFDPACPPELKALLPAKASSATANKPLLERSAQSVPEATLRAIQSCFIAPPKRYETPYEEALAGYRKAEQLCAQAIKAHRNAPDLWLVRNRQMVALMGMWKITLDNRHLKQAADKAQAALDAGYPAGADAIARLCIARQALHTPDADAKAILQALTQPNNGTQPTAPVLAAAALVAMELGNREAYAGYRQALLDQHAEHPSLWPITAFMLDRYHRHWLYRLPFVSGWVYSRREAHGISNLAPENVRQFDLPLKTLDGEAVRFPDTTKGKWAILRLTHPDQIARLSDKPDAFIGSRPFKDVAIFNVMLSDDAQAIQSELDKRKTPPHNPTLRIADDVRDTLERQFGMLHDERHPSLLIIRPDGSVALAASALTYRGMGKRGNIISAFFLRQDEADVDAALAKGDLDEAKRLAFAQVPLGTPAPPGEKQTSKGHTRNPTPVPDQHLHARAKVFIAMGDWKAAQSDANLLYSSRVNQAALMGMRTDDLDEIEQMRAKILEALSEDDPTP